MLISIKSRHNTHYATAEYEGGRVTVLSGSKINTELSFEKMPTPIKNLRKNPEFVNADGIVIADVSFKSPTSAAQFITGRSVNGKIAWRVDDKVSLKNYQQNNK